MLIDGVLDHGPLDKFADDLEIEESGARIAIDFTTNASLNIPCKPDVSDNGFTYVDAAYLGMEHLDSDMATEEVAITTTAHIYHGHEGSRLSMKAPVLKVMKVLKVSCHKRQVRVIGLIRANGGSMEIQIAFTLVFPDPKLCLLALTSQPESSISCGPSRRKIRELVWRADPLAIFEGALYGT